MVTKVRTCTPSKLWDWNGIRAVRCSSIKQLPIGAELWKYHTVRKGLLEMWRTDMLLASISSLLGKKKIKRNMVLFIQTTPGTCYCSAGLICHYRLKNSSVILQRYHISFSSDCDSLILVCKDDDDVLFCLIIFFRLISNQFLSLLGTGKSKMTGSLIIFLSGLNLSFV